MNKACINELKALSKDILSDEDAKALFDEIQRRAKQEALNGVQDINDALEKVGRDLAAETERQAMIEKRNALLNILIKDKINTHLQEFKDEGKGFLAYTGGIQSNIKNSRFSTAALQKSTAGRLMGRFLHSLREGNLLKVFKDRKMEVEIAKELFQEGTTKNSDVAAVAKAIKASYEDSRKMLNNAGADIGTLPEYIARSTHQPEKMLQTADGFFDRMKLRREARKNFTNYVDAKKWLIDTAYTKWRDFMLPLLDQARTFQGQDVEKFMRSAYEAMVSGVRKEAPTDKESKLFAFKGPGNRAKKLSAERIFHFKDGESWYSYNKRYGSGTVQASVINTIERAGHEIGLLKSWGTNPRAMFDTVSRDILERNRVNPGFTEKKFNFSELVFRSVAGEDRVPVDNLLAKIGAGVRAVQTMSKLGNVLFSSLPDIGGKSLLLQRHGESVLGSYGDAVTRFFRGAASKDRTALMDSLATWAGSEFGHMSAYFSAADSPIGSFTQHMQTFMKLTGIEWWDKTNRTATAESISRLLANQRERSYMDLHPGTRETMNLYGLGEKEWDLIRSQPSALVDGKYYITPDAMRYLSDDSIRNYLEKPNASKFEIQRTRDDLEDRLQTYFVDQTDHANIQQEGSDICK